MAEFVFGSLSTVEKRVDFLQEWRAGVKHHSRVTPRAPRPGDRPNLLVTVATDKLIERVDCIVTEPATAVFPLQRVKTEWDLLNWTYMEAWQVTLPAQAEGTLVRYRIEAVPADGSDPIPADDGAIFSFLVTAHAPPAWAEAAIVYQIFPDRFYPGDGRAWNKTESLNDIYGGTLRGVIQKLDYVADMGFNAIWLNPIFPDDTHHGYHATDYFTVNPRLGTMDDVRELVDAAHARGIRLLLDFVANHWGRKHPAFQEAIADPESPFVKWYHWIDYPNDYETFFGVKDLPQVNVSHPDVRDYLLRSVRFWLQEIGFDGLRLDYALGPTHDFWTDLRALVRRIKPDAWLFGEVVETPTTILSYEGRLDGCIDFPLAQAMRNVFALNDSNLTQFDSFLTRHEQFFPRTFSRPSFLDNHDMNRFLWLAQDDKRKLKLAALCQFTLRGQPIVYNGSEVGVHQEMGMAEPGSQGMVESRRPMLWGDDQDADLREFFRRLIHFRREHPALWRGQRETIHLDEEAGTYAYAVYDENETILVGLNLSEETRTITAVFNEIQHQFTLEPWHGDVFVQKISGNH